jgi:hypothetical protein
MRCTLQTSSPPSTCAECALDAIVLGAALLCSVEPHDPRTTHAAARMALICACRRAGLLDTPKDPPMLARFDARLTEFAADPSRMHRAMVATMNRLVGSGRAAEVLTAIEGIGAASQPVGPAGLAWLDRMRAALALPAEPAPSAADRKTPYPGGFRVVAGAGRGRDGRFALRRDGEAGAGGGKAALGGGGAAVVSVVAAGSAGTVAGASRSVGAATSGAAAAVVVHPAAFARTAPASSVTQGVTRK